MNNERFDNENFHENNDSLENQPKAENEKVMSAENAETEVSQKKNIESYVEQDSTSLEQEQLPLDEVANLQDESKDIESCKSLQDDDDLLIPKRKASPELSSDFSASSDNSVGTSGTSSSNDGKTRAFNTKNIPSKELHVNTAVNIKKAKAKKVAIKSLKIFKTIFQWLFNIVMTLLLVGTICGVIVGFAFGIYVMNYLTEDNYDLPELRGKLDITTEIYYKDAEGNDVLYSKIHGTENRSWVTYDEMPKALVDAFLAIEDERYWEHNGVDWKRTFGAALQFVSGNDDYGGSTITQQLIKNVTEEDDTTIQRKVREIFRALSVSKKRTKEEVLEMYLNRIHLSRNNYGIGAAADGYFGKKVKDLTIAECACLASIPKSPTKYDPVRNPENNKERRDVVLEKMYELEWITESEYKEALAEDVKIKGVDFKEETDSDTLTADKLENSSEQNNSNPDAYSYFQDALIEQLIADLQEKYGYTRQYASDLIFSGGLKIYITMDPEVQNAMDEVFEDPDSFKKVDDGIQPQSAMVIMDPDTGYVLGLVGGRGKKAGRLELNRATQSKRQVGSSIKPLTVYAPAMEEGKICYSTVLDDTPLYMEQLNKYWPSNSPNRYVGKITVNEAVVLSKNTTAVKIVQDMGVNNVYNFAKNKLHLTSLVEADNNIAPMALGGFTNGLTVLEMTAAYGVFPSGGYYRKPILYTEVIDSNGIVILENKPSKEFVFSKSTTTVMTKILENVVSYGTAAAIEFDKTVDCAGKTGSTNDNKDVYFAGFTPYYVGACWFGYDQPKDLYKFTPNQAMLAWEKVMVKIHQKYIDQAKAGGAPLKTFESDMGFDRLKTASFCLDSGMVPCDTCNMDIRGTSRIQTGYYYDGKGMPRKQCDVHIMVDWCTVSNYLASPYCPEECRKPVAMIKEYSRSFKHGNIQLHDAFYTYRNVKINSYEEIPDRAPFYLSLLEEDEHIGYMENAPIINRMCITHKPESEPVNSEPLPEQDREQLPPSDDPDLPEESDGWFEVNDGQYDDTLD